MQLIGSVSIGEAVAQNPSDVLAALGISGALNNRGAWSSSGAYAVNDVVSDVGATYVCILVRSATGTHPAGDATHWATLGSSGAALPFRLGTATTPDASADTLLASSDAAKKPLVIQRVAGQTANLFEVQIQNGALLFRIDTNGNVNTGGADIVAANIAGTFHGDGSNLTNLPKRARRFTTVTSSYTIDGTEDIVLIDASAGGLNVTFPDASTLPGCEITLMRIDGVGDNAVTLSNSGSIVTALGTPGSAIFVSDGTNWWCIAHN